MSLGTDSKCTLVRCLGSMQHPSMKSRVKERCDQVSLSLSLSLSYTHTCTHKHNSVFYPFKQSTVKLSRATRVNKYLRLSKHAVPLPLTVYIFNAATHWSTTLLLLFRSNIVYKKLFTQVTFTYSKQHMILSTTDLFCSYYA